MSLSPDKIEVKREKEKMSMRREVAQCITMTIVVFPQTAGKGEGIELGR